MASSDQIEDIEGVVTEVFPAGMFLVRTKIGDIRTTLSGRLRHNEIRIVLGDSVKVAVSPYDLTKGRITYRNK